MGVIDGIKEVYYSWEEKYYRFLDSIDDKFPIYKIIDPIDKVVPSFALFLAVAFILLVFIIFAFVLPFFMPKLSTLSLIVVDKDGTAIANADVTFIVNGKEADAKTDASGIASLTNLKKGEKVKAVVKKDEYLTAEEEFEIAIFPKQEESIALTSTSEGYTVKTIRLMDADGMSPSGTFTLNFSCPDNPYASAPSAITIGPSERGVATVRVPNTCRRLIVSVKDTINYQEIISREVLSDDFVIRLSPIEQLKGKIKVYVKAENGNALEGKKVTLYKYNELLEDPYAGPVDFAYTSNGYAGFEWPSGEYVVKAYDPSGSYSEAEYKDESGNSRVRIEAESEKSITITLKEGIVGKIKIKVIDKASRAAVDKASVRLEYSDDKSPVETLVTAKDSNGLVSFNISRDATYQAFISANGYSSKRVFGLKKSDAVNEAEIERCNPNTCGTLIVKVIGEEGAEGEGIEGASVTLYDYHTKSIAYSGFRTSDINGMAKFRGMKDGSYYAYAFKGSNTAQSICNDPKDCRFESLASDDGIEDLTVIMQIPNGTLRFNVRDEDKKPVAHARVLVYDERTNETVMQSLTDLNGVLSFETKADKKVYARIVTDDAPYKASYTTVARPVEASTVVEFDITLVPPIINKGIEMQSLGLYADGKRALTVAPNSEYTAKFLLKVPESKNYTMAGIHLRTGEEIIMEKDKLYIKSINIPKAGIIKAAYFDESTGYEAEDYEVTAGDAKWLNANWTRPILSGLYEVEATAFVKRNASVGDKLPIHYRAYAENDETERYPADALVSTGLYAAVKTDTYEVGSMTLCGNDFCFAASILDEKEDISEPVSGSAIYNARPFNEYILKFALTNNSDRVHNAANLRISNPDKILLIGGYNFTVAGGIERRQENLNDYEIPRIDLGDFRKNDTATAHEIKFLPQKSGEGAIMITLVSDKSPVWSKAIAISVAAPKDLDLIVSPNIFNVGIENDVNVLVLDKENGLEVENAVVKLLDKHDYVMQSALSKKDGAAYLTIPASSPGTKYKIVAEKEQYNRKEVEIEVNNELIAFNPKSIGINLNAKTKVEADEILTVANVSGFGLKIAEAKLNGTFKSLIDLTRTQNALKSAYGNYTMEQNEKLELHLPVFLSEEGKTVEEPVSLDGKLLVAVENFGKRWSYELPVKITIGIGGEVDNPGCLAITRKEWIGVTEGQPLVVEFEIQNNCVINGRPIELKRLEGTINWKSNQLGKYILKIGDNETELRSGYYKTLFQRLPADSRYIATLKFVPYGGVSGTAEAEISLRASNPLEEKEQMLEAKITSKIGIENVKDCVTFDKEYVMIRQAAQGAQALQGAAQPTEGSFSIRVEKTCTLPYDVRLESKLKLSAKEATIPQGGSKPIQIFAEDKYPGQYPIYVSARMQGEASFKLIETIKVVMTKDGCIQLNRYEFDVYDNPADMFDGYDTAELSNNCTEKVVDVKVNMRDWGKAMKDGLGWGIITMGMGLLSGKGLTGDKSKSGTQYVDNLKDCYDNYGTDICDLGPSSKGKVIPAGKTVCTGRAIKAYRDGTVCCKAATAAGSQQQPVCAQGNAQPGTGPQGTVDELQECKNKGGIAVCDTRTEKTRAQISSGGTDAPGLVCPSGEDAGTLTTKRFCCKGQCMQGDSQKPPAEIPPSQPAAPTRSSVTAPEPAAAEQSAPRTDTSTAAAIQPAATGSNAWVFSSDGTSHQATNDELYTIFQITSAFEPAVQTIPINAEGKVEVLVRVPTSTPGGVSNNATYALPALQGYTVAESIEDYDVVVEISKIEGNNATVNVWKVNQAEYYSESNPAPITGLFDLFGGGSSSGGGGMLGGIGGMGSGMMDSVLGGGSAISQGAKAFLIGAIASYFQQAETFNFKSTQKDLELKPEGIKLLRGEGTAEVVDSDIKLKAEKAVSSANSLQNVNPQNPLLKIDRTGLKFTNSTQLKTTELEPRYDILKVPSTRHKYADKTYAKKDFEVEKSGGLFGFFNEETIKTENVKLDEETSDKVEDKFSLEFNSIPPEIPRTEDRSMLNCQAGTRTGTTGIAAFKGEKAPLRLKLKWGWKDISENECDEGNDNFVYCDGVQFSMEVLQKIKKIDDFLKQNGPSLKCPGQNDVYQQASAIGSNDIGIEKIKKEPIAKGVKITAELKNTNPSEVNADVRIYVTGSDSNAVECKDGIKKASFMSNESISCEFELPNGTYSAYAEITPKNLCPNCLDDQRSNRLALPFTIGVTGLEECEPYSTERLGGFVTASGMAGQNVDKLMKSITFQAHLIKDRYSPDLQKDFDEYYRKYAFMNAPNYYTQQNGLGDYFRDFKLFKFAPKYDEANPEGYALPGPGIYNVTINIKYKDNSWSLFKDGKPNAEIEVKLDKARAPEPNNPLYYLPFDGQVGIESGRSGYGVNFEGDTISIDDSATPLRTITISGATPIEGGTLKVVESRNFKRLNVDDKGVVLKVERGTVPQIIYTPSYATPVMLEFTNNNEDAFGYYSIEVDGSAQDVGYSMAEWYGVGINCRSFSDTLVYDEFWGKADMHALPAENRKCSLVDPQKSATSYGFEFCRPSNFGKLYLQTVLYTPYKSTSLIKKEAASDDMQFIGSTVGGSQMSLGGAKGINYTLDSVEGILNLVRNGYVCVGSSDAKAEFFWNPKAVFESQAFAAKQDYAVNSCISDETSQTANSGTGTAANTTGTNP